MQTARPAGRATAADWVRRKTRLVPDFPSPGIVFEDLSPVFADHEAFAAVIQDLSEHNPAADLIAGLDARGFLVAAVLAQLRGVGVIPIRKAGKLPPPVLSQTYDLEYGQATIEIPTVGLDLSGRTVLIVDDVLATGGTLHAAQRLLTRAGAQVVGFGVIAAVAELDGRGTLPADLPVYAVAANG